MYILYMYINHNGQKRRIILSVKTEVTLLVSSLTQKQDVTGSNLSTNKF